MFANNIIDSLFISVFTPFFMSEVNQVHSKIFSSLDLVSGHVVMSYHLKGKKEKKFLLVVDPCIKGSVKVLKTCIKSKVKKVVLTYSCSSITYRDDVEQVSPLTESHWSDTEYCKSYNVITVAKIYNNVL